MKQSCLRYKLLLVVITCFLINEDTVDAQDTPHNSKNVNHRVCLDGNYSYQRYIQTDATLIGLPFRKIRHGYGMGLNYNYYISNSLIIESGLMLLSDIHVRDSSALFCGQTGNCTYGYWRNAYYSLALPFDFGWETGIGKDYYLRSCAGLIMSKGIFENSKYFYYNGELFNKEYSSHTDNIVTSLSLKIALAYRVNNVDLSLTYRLNRPLNNLDRSYRAYTRHSIGIGVGIWSK